MPIPLKHVFDTYVQWTATAWVGPRLPLTSERLRDKLVMSLGLAGETGEVAEVVAAWGDSGVCARADLLKEMGDVGYYLGRLCHEFNVSLPLPAVPPCANLVRPGEVPVLRALHLVAAAGQVSEVVKKYVRDGRLPPGKLELALCAVFTAWVDLCVGCNLDWSHVLETNRAKMEGRVERGTVRGSGNER